MLARPSVASVVAHSSGSSPIRTCVGCRQRHPSHDLLRVAVVSGALAPDLRQRIPGRGAWLHPNTECLRLAQRRRAFPRALRVVGELDDTELVRHIDGVDGVVQ